MFNGLEGSMALTDGIHILRYYETRVLNPA